MDHPTVQEARGTAQAQANRLMSEGKDRLSHSKFGEKLSSGNGGNGARGSDELASSSPTKPTP